jgi:hypothetical protein
MWAEADVVQWPQDKQCQPVERQRQPAEKAPGRGSPHQRQDRSDRTLLSLGWAGEGEEGGLAAWARGGAGEGTCRV